MWPILEQCWSNVCIRHILSAYCVYCLSQHLHETNTATMSPVLIINVTNIGPMSLSTWQNVGAMFVYVTYLAPTIISGNIWTWLVLPQCHKYWLSVQTLVKYRSLVLGNIYADTLPGCGWEISVARKGKHICFVLIFGELYEETEKWKARWPRNG